MQNLGSHKGHYLHWGAPEKQPLVFVHGNGAHAHWWDFIAPAFSDRYQVFAIDLCGMGDSEHRDTYSIKTYVDDILTFVGSLDTKPMVIGHSFGGRICYKAVLQTPEIFQGLVLVDVPFYPSDHNFEWANRPLKVREHKRYRTLEEAVGDFRLSPPQPCSNQYILNHIARNSFHQQSNDWFLKFDPRLFSQLDYLSLVSDGASPDVPLVASIYGGSSITFAEPLRQFNASVLPEVGLIEIADAGHHVFLDKPLEFVDVLRDLLRT